MRLKTTLAVGAAALVATASLVAPTSCHRRRVRRPRQRLVLPGQEARRDVRRRAPAAVMVHGATLQQARSAVTATGMNRVTSFRKIGVVVATGTSVADPGRAQPARRDLRRGQPGHRALPGLQQRRDPRLRGDPDRERRGRLEAHRQGRQRRGHRLRRRPDPPLLQGGRRHERRRGQPQDAVRPARGVLHGPEAAEHRRHRHAVRSAATAPTSTASSPADPTTLSSGKKLQGAAPGAKLVSVSTGAALVHHRRRRRPQLGAREPRGTVWRRRPGRRRARRSRSPTTPTARAVAASSTPSPPPSSSSARWPPKAS